MPDPVSSDSALLGLSERARSETLQMIRFALVGLFNTSVGLVTFLIGYKLFGLSLVIANAASYPVAIMISFFLTKAFVFRNGQPNSLGRFLKFAACAAVAYGANLVAFLIVEGWGVLPGSLIHVAGMVTYTTSFYLLNKFLVFRTP
jgi:putative flippase GtrA